MNAISAGSATTFLSVLILAAALPAQTTGAAAFLAPIPGASRVRIVRLSEVKGEVQADRNTGSGFEPAMTNLPVVERMRLRTGDGVAEVEFEDNSTLRLAPNSMVDFPQLERLPSGATVSSVDVRGGTAYVSLEKTKGNEFNLLFGPQELALGPATHIRLQMEGQRAKLAVLDGPVQVGNTEVPHKKTITFDLQGQSQPTVAKNVAEEPYDTWDKDSAGYHARAATVSALSSTPYAYGLNDMAYYGSFMDAGGCGMMWRPYFAGAGWDPYSNGAWAWYPGGGYSWVSPYPWGWTPYHFGSWMMCPGMGWGWQPGGAWSGINNTALVVRAGPGHYVLPPSHPPRPGAPTMAVVNMKPAVFSQMTRADSFVFRKGSAGLGIPRGALGNLNHFSREVNRHGIATTPVYVSLPRSAMPGMAGGRISPSALNAASIHRGYAMPQGGVYGRGGGVGARGGFNGGAGHASASPGGSSGMSSAGMGGGHASAGGGHGH